MTARTITTAAELDALPVGSVVRTARGAVATRHERARVTVLGWLVAGYFGPQVLYADTDLPAVVLYDPSAPVVPVVSDAAVEAASERVRVWLLGLGTLTLAQVDDLAPQIARSALSAALPHLGAAPSVTREGGWRVAHETIGTLHVPLTHDERTGWQGEPFVECAQCRRAWPCPTRVALDAITPRTDR